MLSTFLQTVFWILFVVYGISRIMMNTGIRLFVILEDVLMIPFAISIPITACVVLEWISNKSVETFITIAGLIIIAIVVIFQIYKKSLELSFGSDEQLNRSKAKTKLMKSAIIGYKNWRNSNNYLDNKDLDALQNLYDFLCQDEILKYSIEEFSFDEMLQKIMYMHLGMDLNYSKHYDFIPISAFCFLPTLSFLVSHKNKEISDGELKVFLLNYFNNN